MYAKMYIPAYTNFGSFLCGMIGGILYYKYRQEDNRPRKSKVPQQNLSYTYSEI